MSPVTLPPVDLQRPPAIVERADFDGGNEHLLPLSGFEMNREELAAATRESAANSSAMQSGAPETRTPESASPSTETAPPAKRGFVSRVGGDGRVAAAVLAGGAALTGGLRLGAEPGLKALQDVSPSTVAMIAGAELPPKPDLNLAEERRNAARIEQERAAQMAADGNSEVAPVPRRR